MEASILKDITNYIDFLRSYGYSISLSCFENRFEPFTTELLSYEIHLHSVCNYLKQCKGTAGRCVSNKRRLNKSHIEAPLFSCCYAGVEEYVIPVMYGETRLMYIHVSGYRGTLKESEQRMRQISEICDESFLKAYMELSSAPPSLDEIMKFIKPLEYMITELYRFCRKEYKNSETVSPTKAIYLKAMKYIHENYMHKICCESLAKEMSYSPSYLRYIFKKEGDTSVKKQLNEIRLERAKYLLQNTASSITEIAFSCGFCDSNYFSTAFKARYGISPKAYRATRA